MNTPNVAKSPGNTARTTRRALILAGASALPALALPALALTPATAAVASPKGVAASDAFPATVLDAELIELGRQLDLAVSQETSLEARRRTTWKIYDKRKPRRSSALRWRPTDNAIGFDKPLRAGIGRGDDFYGKYEVDQLREIPDVIEVVECRKEKRRGFDFVISEKTKRVTSDKQRAAEIVAAFESWSEKDEKLRIELRLADNDPEMTAIGDHRFELEREIMVRRGRSVEGIAVKARAALYHYEISAPRKGSDGENTNIASVCWHLANNLVLFSIGSKQS